MRIRFWQIASVAGLLGCFFLVSSRFDAETVDAAPFTVRANCHPFDPDWPDVYLMLAVKCAHCHRPGTDRTDLTSYAAVIAAIDEEGLPVVAPGRPEDSSLWTKLTWNHNEARDSEYYDEPEMPPERDEWLTGNQIEIVQRWITNGALEYELPQTCSTRPLMEIDFPSAKQCRVCHPKQYEEWSRSMHAYAQHSPVMEAFNLTLIERTGGTIDTFCTRCHTPIGTALGENGSRRNVNRSRLSMEGVTCAVCHRISRPYYKANVRMSLTPGKLLDACFFGPFDDPVSRDFESHHSAGRSHLKSAAFCGACHDVTNPQGVRLEEAFSEWQNSPAARDGITCQNCHMGPIQGVPFMDHQRPLGRAATVPGVDPESLPLRHLSDHTFAGPDYSLLPDTEFPYKLDWMYETDYRDQDSLTSYQKETLKELRLRNRRQLKIATEKRYELLRNAGEIAVSAPQSADCGEKVRINVAVTSKVAGHNFPTGFSAERQLWVEIAVVDPDGRTVFHSGNFDPNGDLLDGHSHYVEAGKLVPDKYLLNMQSKFVALTNRGTERSVVIPVNRHLAPLNVIRPAPVISAAFGRPPVFRVAKGSLLPLATVKHSYPIRLPERPGLYRVYVRLNFRHLPPVLLDKIGVPHLKHQLETVVIDSKECFIQVGD